MPLSGSSPDASRSGTTLCWAAKGGSGTTVVSAALALSPPRPVVVVDLAGDLPAVFGLPEPGGPGVHDWLASDAPAEQLHDLTVGVCDEVTLLPAGTLPGGLVTAAGDSTERWDDLLSALTSDGHRVVIDGGTGVPPVAAHELVDRSLLVTRSCYMALRRAVASPLRPSAIVLVSEPGRALRAIDVETAVGAPVIATVAIDPAVARAVDAGLLAARLPRLIQRDLRGAA
ncbi:hypothetical protein BH23ACT3_BH23ACT3_16980 [soil metagenome]